MLRLHLDRLIYLGTASRTSRAMSEYKMKKRVCIIGAGTAGLCALKHALANDFDCVCYEQAKEIGGTWVYIENIDHIQSDEDIHSSMYEGLRTNLPKEIMGYPDFSYDDAIEESFITSQEVLEFLQSYTIHFRLQPHIKLQHEVIRVRPVNELQNFFWEVYVKNLATDEYRQEKFDFIFVCNGHYSAPQWPEIKDMEVFQGKQLHSHRYRKASAYKDETVLIIGAGPSGMDIACHLHKYAQHVYLSHHLSMQPKTDFMHNVIQKPDVDRFTKTGVIFKDGTSAEISTVIYCTGYKYEFPCLSVDCEIFIADNCVHTLYKHCINVSYPSMAIIGLPFKVCPSHLFDLQVRFALKYFTHEKELPSTEQMIAEFEEELNERAKQGIPQRRFHEMGERQADYYKELAETAGIVEIKPVIGKIMRDCKMKYIYDLDTYRNAVFKLIDDENFVKFIK